MPSWNYMDTILASWAETGIRTPEEIEAKDPRPMRRQKASARTAAAPQDDSKTLGQLARLRDRMRSGEA